MNSSTKGKIYLVTGANIGLGLEATRQLALLPDTKRVYLACRTESKAKQAIQNLVAKHKSITHDKLQFIPFDASADKDTIVTNVRQSLANHHVKMDGLIFNAGGVGQDKTGVATGPNHVMDMIQINLIGHIHLLDALMANDHLQPHATIVYAGSEGARGVAFMGMAPPKLPDSVKDYDALITTGRFGGKKKPKNFDAMDYYLHVKGVAALYWSAWAREHPEYHVLTVSPGMTRGTNIGSHEAMPAPFRVMLPVMMKVCGVFGLSHSVSKGAKRYTDAVRHQGSYDQYSSGSFVASVRGASGRVGDQSKHKKGAMYGNVAKQNAAYQAVQAYA